MAAYRYRQCIECDAVFPAGKMRVVLLGSHWHKEGVGTQRVCPYCGYMASTREFLIVPKEKYEEFINQHTE